MRKRIVLTILITILLSGSLAACKTGLKMVNREISGTATLTPFLLKATFTSTSTPMMQAGSEELDHPAPSETLELAGSEEQGEGENSPTPSATPTSTYPSTTNPVDPSNTPIPTKPPATSKPTQPPGATNTPKPPADTNTPKPPADTNTPKPPGDTNTPIPPADTNTPKPPTATPTPGECVFSGNSSYEDQVIALINQERTDRGLSALTKNSSLTQAARTHSQDMACNDNWSHTGTDGSTLATRILAAGYSYSWAAENIAASSSQYFSAASVVSMWMGSTGHRNNILSPSAVHIGVGFRYAGDVDLLPYDAYYTADFGAPR